MIFDAGDVHDTPLSFFISFLIFSYSKTRQLCFIPEDGAVFGSLSSGASVRFFSWLTTSVS